MSSAPVVTSHRRTFGWLLSGGDFPADRPDPEGGEALPPAPAVVGRQASQKVDPEKQRLPLGQGQRLAVAGQGTVAQRHTG
jgi:hypothetical protein